MATNLRTLGIRGRNLPTKRSPGVQPADFSIGGVLLESERSYATPFSIGSPEEFQEIFGSQVIPSQYGPDFITGFFNNLRGVNATLIVQSLVGYDIGGDAIDAVVATADVADAGADADAYTLEAAYKEELEYGASGNRTGFRIASAIRFTTLASAIVPATGQSYAELDSVVGIRTGDIILFRTNSGADLVYKKVTSIDETLNRVFWAGDFEVSGASGEALAVDDVVDIPGFTIKTYRKSIKGVESEVDRELGLKICSSEAEVSEFYVENIHAENRFLKISEASASTLGDRLPVANATTTYLASGADGTAVVTVEAQDFFLAKMFDQPIRFIANPETTDITMQKALEIWSKTRDDNPKVIFNIAEDQSKAQLKVIGSKFQRSDEVDGVIVANWLKVTDPFSNSNIAPSRHVPNVGHVMGAWIYSIVTLGVHYIPSVQSVTLQGIVGVVGETFKNDEDRTEVAEYGVNMIQELDGVGFKIMNFFTPSTDLTFSFANGILMRDFLKISIRDSLSASENTPNSLNRISNDKMSALTFGRNLWERGSTGQVPAGETFGQTLTDAGEPTAFGDHFQVTADITNNPQSQINAGERNIDIYFSYPAPAGSIFIGVGILLRG